jgi:hypothetical protein
MTENATAEEVKAAVPMERLLEGDGRELRRSGPNRVCRCPLHDERDPSFTLYPDGRWYCYGCGQGGDVFNYMMERDGITFPEAKAKLAEMAGVSPIESPVRAPSAPPAREGWRPYVMSSDEVGRAVQMALCLATRPLRIARVAEARGWLLQTVREAALTPCLGWHEGKLAFIYSSGVKLRWRDASGERRIIWEIGKPSLWRGELIGSWIKKVFVCEGETDALAMIDSGAELDGETLVTALPSANKSGFPTGMLEPLRGKAVIVALDGDETGIACAAKVAEALAGIAKSVAVMDWSAIK